METFLLTMEEEVVTFVLCCQELFLILDLVDQTRDAVGLRCDERYQMNCKVHEDNIGALVLLTTPPRQFTH